MTRRELFRRYAAEHFTAPDVSAAGRARCRGAVERQTSRARLASLARITPRHPLPGTAGSEMAGAGMPAQRWSPAVGGVEALRIPAQRSRGSRPGTSDS
ncbi:hypothetical protein [Kitasatospora sp. NPDC088783]|uniref:hypothetical protein n=1 Tax=Kitasatospora sp. NPDC088783 TaxID=3364077 RepID=UPI0037F685A7